MWVNEVGHGSIGVYVGTVNVVEQPKVDVA